MKIGIKFKKKLKNKIRRKRRKKWMLDACSIDVLLRGILSPFVWLNQFGYVDLLLFLKGYCI